MLLTGKAPTFMRTDLTAPHCAEPVVSAELLWWPPAKIVGRYLARVLAGTLPYGETAHLQPGYPSRST
jgi:hypothetical protein